jgi:hypothetical protein
MPLIHPKVDRRILLGALTTLLVLLAGAFSADRASAFEVGVQDNPVFTFNKYVPRDTALAKAKAFNARSVRLEMYWGDFVRYGFAPYDDAVKAALRRGLRPQISVAGTPNYDPDGDQRVSWLNPNVSAYASFLTQVARHFKGRVKRYSIWNEPNQCYFLSKSSCSYSNSAVKQRQAIYRNLYIAGAAAIKRADRKAQVLFGELAPINNPLGFLTAVTLRGGVRADGFAQHPYQIAPKGRKVTGVSATPKIKSLLRSLARSRKFRTYSGGTVPIYFTEYAVIKGYGGIRSEAARASRTVSDFKYMKRQGIKQIIWYHLVIYPSTVRDFFPSGILNTNGTGVPTYNALVKARRSW